MLRKLPLVIILILIFAFNSNCQTFTVKKDQSSLDNPPFYGTRYFNFYGGSGTGHSMTIKKDNTVIIYDDTDPASGNKPSLFFKGPYKRIMTVPDPEAPVNSTDSMQIKFLSDSTIAKLDKKGNVATGCSNDGVPCISQFYK